MRSSRATTSVRAWIALFEADSLTNSTRAPPVRGQPDEPGHHPPTQDVVAQLGTVGLNAHLEVAGTGHQVDQAGRRVDQSDGLLGAPGQQSGHENEHDREQRGDEEEPPVADGAPQVDPDDRDHGVTMRRTRVMARPPVTTGDQAQDEEGPDDRRRRIVQQRQAPESDQGPPVRRPEAQHLQCLGSAPGGAGCPRAAPGRGRPPARRRRPLAGVRAKDVTKAPRPHMAAVAPTHSMSTPSGAPQSAPKAAAVTPQHDQDGGQPGDADGQELPPARWRSAGWARRQPGQGPRRALHQERAHAEAAPDEEEHHGDGRREVVEHRLAAVAQRARRDRDGGGVRGRAGRQAAGVEPAGQARRQRLAYLLPDQRVRPGPQSRTRVTAWRPAPPSG